jgi:hypothetical protein
MTTFLLIVGGVVIFILGYTCGENFNYDLKRKIKICEVRHGYFIQDMIDDDGRFNGERMLLEKDKNNMKQSDNQSNGREYTREYLENRFRELEIENGPLPSGLQFYLNWKQEQILEKENLLRDSLSVQSDK